MLLPWLMLKSLINFGAASGERVRGLKSRCDVALLIKRAVIDSRHTI
eukprot:COSAG01_NODE_18942_length_1042_cov_1.072110_1_plen_46_part_10